MLGLRATATGAKIAAIPKLPSGSHPMPRSFLSVVPVAVALLAGCRPTPIEWPSKAASGPATEPGTAFDPARTGTLSGKVTWAGDVPDVPHLESVATLGTVPNPHAPRIDPNTRGLAGAVVFLRDLDPATGRAWDLPPACVEMSATAIRLIPGDGPPQTVGFVKRGAEVPMRSTEAGRFMLRARGATFFTLAFPEPGRPLSRRFDTCGVVEFASGSGQFWAAADLFVCDHPYYTTTGPDGSFTLPRVPAGEHELVAWVRDWHIVGKDRDPETGLVSRLKYADPIEKRAAVHVEPGRPAATDLAVGLSR
jgi:hypothetical protein